MKMKSYQSIMKATLTVVVVSAMASGCKKDFFNLEDPNGINSNIWNDEGAVTQYIDKGYDLMMPNWPTPGGIHNTSDELNNANTGFLYGQFTDNSVTDIASSNSITGNRYFDIRRCNVGIDGINAGTMSEGAKKLKKGELFFFRAMVYFNLVRLYGGVPLVLHAQDLVNDELNVPRSKTSLCIDQISSDLDSAALFLPATWPTAQKGRITKGVAYALKGKVLMYWASPQFNTANDAARWEKAYTACKMAYDTCVANGNTLYSNYANIFVDESATNKEVMLVRVHDAISVSPGRGTNNEYITRPRSETTGQAGGGSNQPTWNLVQAYTMGNGLPITDPSSGYNATLFWLNRDPRFQATIAYNGAPWPLSSNVARKQWNYTGVLDEGSGLTQTGFYCKKLCNPAISAIQTQYNSNSGGGSGMDWIEMRFAEVIMNLAECANETGRLAEAKNMVRLIRQRAGIVVGTQDYGLNLATTATQLRDLIMNERMVEFAMEGKRAFDLRRTRRLHLLTGTIRQGIKWTPKLPYVAGTGTDATKIYLDRIYPAGFKPRDTANLNNPAVYAAMFTPSLVNLDATQPISIPTTYYFYPLPNFFRQSSFVLEQTIGWPGGTFDPLQ
jgi:starch-binding outer membrane protein, SusD/RagB family